MNKLRRIFYAVRLVLAQGSIVQEQLQWDEKDRENYERFRRSATGEKLNVALRNYISLRSIQACEDGKTERVAGVRESVAFLDTLRPNFGAAPTGSNSRESDAQSDTEIEAGHAWIVEHS